MVLVEMLMVVGIIALIAGIAMISFGAMWGNQRFKSRAEELVNTFQMAYEAAVQSDRRYAVILDQYNGRYFLRQFETVEQLMLSNEQLLLSDEEPVISAGLFDDDFQLDRIVFDDSLDTADIGGSEELRGGVFTAGHAGWLFGGIVILRDRDGNPWSIVIYRLGRPVELVEGYAEMLTPQTRDKVPF